MPNMNNRLDRMIRNEEMLSKHINIISHYDDNTLLDKSGKLIQIIKLSGIDHVTKDNHYLNLLKERRNNFLKNFSSQYAFYFYEIRKRNFAYPAGDYQDGFSKEVNEKYKAIIDQNEMFHTELYLAIMTKQPEGFLNRGLNILKQLNYSVDKNAKFEYLRKRHKELEDIIQKSLDILADYNPRVLGVYDKGGVKFSESLEFISQLIHFEEFNVPLELTVTDASKALPRKRFSFNGRAGTIEIRSGDNKKKFAAVLSIKSYQPLTYAGMLDEIGLLKIEYVITQSYRFYDRQAAKTKLRDQQKDMSQSKDESARQTLQIDEAFEDAASGDVGYGSHHFTLTCYADTQEQLNKNVGAIIAKFSDLDIVCVREDIACEPSFWAQLPGNFGYIMRPADISTKNMAAFASLHNTPMGKMSNNHWGEAVTVFETISGSPYYFNFHYKDVGNFLIFGAMGSGKTVLVGFLILQTMKFGGKRIIFDKDRGLEILVRAMGGVYEILKPGVPTGFNPCHLEDIAANRQFLAQLFKKMLSSNRNLLTENDLLTIQNAISGMYRLDKSERQFCHIASFFGLKKNDSLRTRFDEWHSEGAYAWVFDNPEDSLNLNPDVIGLDLTHLLSDEQCKTPALMYLTYRIEAALQNHRGILFCDEGWKFLNDEYFRGLINDWSRTPRKKNNIFGLATQVANDTIDPSVSKAINESAFCKIFFPNPAAESKTYIEEFGLTESEYNLVKSLPDDQHYFLLNQGRGTNKQSVIIRANLKGLEDELAIISARESTLTLLDQIRAEVGDDPKMWLPVFNERRKLEGRI